MTKTQIALTGLILALSGVFFLVPQQADAACSYNGFINSGGKCAKSWENTSWEKRFDENRDEIQERFYSSRDEMLARYIEQLLDLIARLEAQRDGYNYNSDDFAVTTRSAINIEDTEADLRGRVVLDDEDEVDVWFEYGTSRYDLDADTSKETIDENDSEYFTITVDDLDEGDVYYYRAVAENEDGDKEYGAILSFRTDGSSDDEPVATTRSAVNVEDTEAELRGSIDMNDFNNGIVFFVYGEDEDAIDDVENDFDTYDDVDENGDDLQKVRVDSDLDTSASFTETVTGLDNDTDYYFRICVEYENEDGDETFDCGSVLDFRTDN